LNAREIIEQAKTLNAPNKGIVALVNKDCCIMDELCCRYPYKSEGGCLDYNRCSDDEYMLACLTTRDASQLAQWVMEAYSEALTVRRNEAVCPHRD